MILSGSWPPLLVAALVVMAPASGCRDWGAPDEDDHFLDVKRALETNKSASVLASKGERAAAIALLRRELEAGRTAGWIVVSDAQLGDLRGSTEFDDLTGALDVKRPGVNEPAPPFRLPLLRPFHDETDWSPGAWLDAGESALVAFVPLRCPRCIDALEDLTRLHAPQDHRRLLLVGVGGGEAAVEELEARLEEVPKHVPIATDPMSKISQQYNVGAITTLFIIDRDGYIRERVQGLSAVLQTATRLARADASFIARP